MNINFYSQDGGQSGRGPISGLQIVEVQPQGEIPEPATMALLGLAVCGLGGYTRKRRTA